VGASHPRQTLPGGRILESRRAAQARGFGDAARPHSRALGGQRDVLPALTRRFVFRRHPVRRVGWADGFARRQHLATAIRDSQALAQAARANPGFLRSRPRHQHRRGNPEKSVFAVMVGAGIW
jgi:hypothetical protein